MTKPTERELQAITELRSAVIDIAEILLTAHPSDRNIIVHGGRSGTLAPHFDGLAQSLDRLRKL